MGVLAAGLRRKGVISQEWPAARVAGGIDGRLLLGALLFGGGWGATGFCPVSHQL